VLYVCGPDLWETADQALLGQAADRVDCLIVQDLVRSPLAERAHIVLPSLTFAEKTGTFTNHAGRVQRLSRAITPADGQLSDGEIFTLLLRRIVEAPVTFEPAAVLDEIAQAVPAYAGLSFDGVGSLGYPLPDGTGAGAPAGAAS
jgi:predicted molibdopterin-dependent oxidoreductase YjgC